MKALIDLGFCWIDRGLDFLIDRPSRIVWLLMAGTVLLISFDRLWAPAPWLFFLFFSVVACAYVLRTIDEEVLSSDEPEKLSAPAPESLSRRFRGASPEPHPSRKGERHETVQVDPGALVPAQQDRASDHLSKTNDRA